jgi:hypothetical protein
LNPGDEDIGDVFDLLVAAGMKEVKEKL